MTPDSYSRQIGGQSTSGSQAAGTFNSRGASANPTETVSFRDLGLNKQLCSALAKSRYTQPTPIQHTAIPLVLQGKDLLGCARTGTGKTAAFALPILQMMMEGDDRRAQDGEPRRGRHHKPWIRCLVLAPTRELAAQIHENFEKYAGNADLRSLVVFGGVGKHPQIQSLQRGVDILVATPGRLLDLHQQGYVDLGDVEYYVLDEGDRMLDMGFIHDVRRITNLIPDDRQTLLFSATMPKEIQNLAGSMLYEPVKVAVDPVSSTNKPTKQSVYFVDKAHKVDLLVDLLAAPELQSVLVFTRTKHGADKVAKKLVGAGIQASAIHGNKSQGARERTLAGIKAGKIRVVVATDIAARGIDVKGLTHVINFDLPNIPENYVHRVGRTGRAGKTGIAIALCASEEQEYLRDIEKLTNQRLEVLRSRFENAGSAGGREAALAGRRTEKRGRPTRTPIRHSSTGRAPTRRARGKSGGRSRRPAHSASTR